MWVMKQWWWQYSCQLHNAILNYPHWIKEFYQEQCFSVYEMALPSVFFHNFIFFEGVVLSTKLWTYLIFKIGNRRVLILSLLSSIIVTAITAIFVENFWIFTLLRCISGVWWTFCKLHSFKHKKKCVLICF